MTLQDTDCSICLQPFVHPVQLPCSHIFCFLCIKGCAFRSRRCPICRGRFSVHFFDDPKLVQVPSSTYESVFPNHQAPSSAVETATTTTTSSTEEVHCDPETPAFAWFYEGYSGWWQYDERTSEELEEAFTGGLGSCDLSVAGFIYSIDLHNMSQRRKDHPGRKRRIKRDVINCPKKGIAGIKLDAIQPTIDGTASSDLPCPTTSTQQIPLALSDHTYAALPITTTPHPTSSASRLIITSPLSRSTSSSIPSDRVDCTARPGTCVISSVVHMDPSQGTTVPTPCNLPAPVATRRTRGNSQRLACTRGRANRANTAAAHQRCARSLSRS